jgi:hypothetical protein
MTEREKVLNDLQELCEYLFHEYKVCYQGDEEDTYNRFLVANNALNLLKQQEAVEPILKREGLNKYYNYYVCPCCDEEVVYDQNYCSECGAKFMWEGR